MTNAESILSILAEYGIKNAGDLQSAYNSLEKVDISPFCNPVPKKQKEIES